MKVVIPNVNLKKFYRLCAFQKISSKDLKLNETTFRSYLKFRDYLFGGPLKAESYTIFLDKLRKRLLSKVISKEDLSHLTDKPLNPMIFKEVFEKKKREISVSSAKALLSLLMKVYLLDEIPIIKSISITDEATQDKELIYYYLLRNKDLNSVKKVKQEFRDHQRLHRINDYLIELWIDDKIEIKGLDIPKSLCRDSDYKNLPLDEVKEYKSKETFRIRETGELRTRVSLSDSYKLYPKGE